MHIAYSAISNKNPSAKNNATARYEGYLNACQKHAQTIADIRRYIPNWEPQLALGSEQFIVGSLQMITIK